MISIELKGKKRSERRSVVLRVESNGGKKGIKGIRLRESL